MRCSLGLQTCDLRPYADGTHQWWVVSDISELATGPALPLDHVLGIDGASVTPASWTVRPAVQRWGGVRTVGREDDSSWRQRALDLGTGCGVRSLHLSGHADSIVAADISERALDFARFNAALNDLSLDLRTGSMLEPVAGQRLDPIVSNPPFVITPRAACTPRGWPTSPAASTKQGGFR